MALPAREVANIYRAALVHDIGIVAVPSFLLNKQRAQLTEAEWERLRLHPYHSARILSKLPAMEALVPIVGAHHERMDGQGYYRGLPGVQIPPAARIIAVADRFAELSHDMPDHAALDPDDVVKLMRQEVGSGLAFDAFQALVEDLSGVSQATRTRLPRQEWPSGLTDREVEVLRLITKV
jgi:HD-GYP domain-containing protein (c-di-GMP phosphodiesterase class II)